MHLTREQANEIFRYKKRELDKGFTHEVDHLELASACELFYKDFLNMKCPTTFIAECPTQALDLLNHLIGSRECSTSSKKIDFGRFSNDFSIRKEINQSVFDLVKRLKQAVKDQIGFECFKEVRNLLFRDFNFQYSQSVFQVIERSILTQWTRAEKNIAEFSAHPSYADRDWLHLYKGCSEVLSVSGEQIDTYLRFITSGLFSGYYYQSFAILVPVPDFISKNENLVLHNEERPAVSWNQGMRIAYWNGIEVPEKLISQPELITASDILNETNAEVRRCYQEKLGSEKFGNLLGLIVLDEKSDRFGNVQRLYRTKEVDKIAGDFIYFAKVVCPSTGRNYFLCVPPGLSGVEEAVAWTFGKTPGDYRPSIET
jgi:hypothetical protein